MATRDVVEQFVEAMTQLMTLMRREIDVLKAREYSKLEEIQRHKAAMGKTYDHCQDQLRKDTSVLAALSTEERGELRMLYASFREALSENMLALKAAQDATDRAVKMIVDGVKKARGVQGQPARAPGKPVRGYAAYSGNNAGSFAINRTT